MYSVCPEAGELWHQLLGTVSARAGVPLRWHEHAAPAPLGELWRRPDLGAVFMCGLPYSAFEPRPRLIAAPVPSPVEFGGRPRYFSELVVRADSAFQSIEDTFGGRIAFTTADSQSGYAAAVFFLMQYPAAKPLYREVIAPRITPLGAVTAVLGGRADVAPIDAYAHRLLQRYRSDLTGQLRVVARTAPTAIPAFVASAGPRWTRDQRPRSPRTVADEGSGDGGHPRHGEQPRDGDSLAEAFARIHQDPAAEAAMTGLLLQRFARPEPPDYEALRANFEAGRRYWRRHALAEVIHPGFLV